MDPDTQPPPTQRVRRDSLKFRIVVLAAILGVAMALLYAYISRGDPRIDAVIVSSRESVARERILRVMDRCGGQLSLESANRELQVWKVPSRKVDACMTGLSRLTDQGVVAEARVNWLCYPLTKRRSWFSSLWSPAESLVMTCPNENAQFNYITGLSLPLAELAPISAAQMPIIEDHRTVVLPDPTTSEPVVAQITGASVAAETGFQIWFELPNGGYGTLLRSLGTTVGDITIGSASFHLRPNPNDQALPQPSYVWLPSEPDDPKIPLHSEAASAGVNLSHIVDPAIARSFNHARERTTQEREAQSLYRNEYGDAFRDLDGTTYQESCPANPPLPVGLTVKEPIQLRVLFGYTQSARDELVGKISEAAARTQIERLLDQHVGTINQTFSAQGVPLQLIRAGSTSIRGLDPVLPKIKVVQQPNEAKRTWVDVVAKDLIYSRENCPLAADSCEFRADPQDAASEVPIAIRQLAYEALEPAFVTERRRAKADIVAIVVGKDQLYYDGQAANVRTSFYTSFLFLRAQAFRLNTLEHEIGHLLGVRHQRCVACPKPSCDLTLQSESTQCLCKAASACASEWDADEKDKLDGAPIDNHAFTFVAVLNKGDPHPADKRVMLGTVGSNFKPKLDTYFRTRRIPRWSSDDTTAMHWEPPDFSAPRPFLLSNPSATEMSNEARIITVYGACASRFISSPEDGFTASVIADPTWTPISPDTSGPYDAPLTSPSLADLAPGFKQIRDPQRTVYFDTGTPFPDNPYLLGEQTNALDELLWHLSIEAATDGDPTTNAVSKTFFVEGYADRVGGENDNCALAHRRAYATALALCARMPDATVGVKGYGEQWPTVLTDDGVAESRNRRAVISWPDAPLTQGGVAIEVESCRSFKERYKDRSPSCGASSAKAVATGRPSDGTRSLNVWAR